MRCSIPVNNQTPYWLDEQEELQRCVNFVGGYSQLLASRPFIVQRALMPFYARLVSPKENREKYHHVKNIIMCIS